MHIDLVDVTLTNRLNRIDAMVAEALTDDTASLARHRSEYQAIVRACATQHLRVLGDLNE